MLKSVLPRASLLSSYRDRSLRALSVMTRSIRPLEASQHQGSGSRVHVRMVTSTTQHSDQTQPNESNSDKFPERVKEYSEMPGFWKIPIIGISPEVFKTDPKRFIQYLAKVPEKYGNIFKMKLAPGMAEFVCVFDPEDTKKVFRSEGKYPERLTIDIWEDSRKAVGRPMGIFFLKGEEWHKQRMPMSKFMAVPRKVAEYYEPFNEVTEDLVKVIRRNRDDNALLVDASGFLQKWAFESVNWFVLGRRLGCLEEQVPPNAQEYIDQLHNFFTASQKLLFGLPLYKLYATKDYKELLKSFERLFEISLQLIKERLDEIKDDVIDPEDDEGPPVGVDFLTYMTKAGQMPLETITTNALDLLAAGVDTTSNTLLWALYSLAMNPSTQNTLRAEIERVVRADPMVTPAHIQQMPYLRDVIKETLRLYAIAPNNTRVLNTDIVLSGYKVPAGTTLLMPVVASGAQADLFPEPEKFKPERWSRTNQEPPNVFASLPFGFGTRMCVGRRVAELELHIGLAQLIRTFKVEFRDDKPMDYVQNIFLSPERRFDLAFVDL